MGAEIVVALMESYIQVSKTPQLKSRSERSRAYKVGFF